MFKRDKPPARSNLVTLRVTDAELAELDAIRKRLKVRTIAEVLREALSLLSESPEPKRAAKRA